MKDYKYIVHYGHGSRQCCYTKEDVLHFIRHLLNENEGLQLYIEKK